MAMGWVKEEAGKWLNDVQAGHAFDGSPKQAEWAEAIYREKIVSLYPLFERFSAEADPKNIEGFTGLLEKMRKISSSRFWIDHRDYSGREIMLMVHKGEVVQ